jgi:hypothetical protein
MTKKSKSKPASPKTPAGSVSLATAADLATASKLPPSNRKNPINEVSTTIAAIYATPAIKASLLKLQPQVAVFDGCGDLAAVIAAAEESTGLEPVYLRLRALSDRVGQQIIENNKVVQPADTALARAYRTSAPGTIVQKGLAALVKLRESAGVRKKAVRTKNKNVKKKAAGQAKAQ